MFKVENIHLGRVKHSLDLPYADYAIDKKSQKLFILSKTRLQVQEFHAVTGKFVQSVETDQGYIFLSQNHL